MAENPVHPRDIPGTAEYDHRRSEGAEPPVIPQGIPEPEPEPPVIGEPDDDEPAADEAPGEEV